MCIIQSTIPFYGILTHLAPSSCCLLQHEYDKAPYFCPTPLAGSLCGGYVAGTASWEVMGGYIIVETNYRVRQPACACCSQPPSMCECDCDVGCGQDSVECNAKLGLCFGRLAGMHGSNHFRS